MHFEPDPADEIFRQEVRQFIRAHLPEDIARRARRGYHPERPDLERWTRILNQRGWAAPHWPTEYGGTGWSPLRRHIFQEELRAAHAPVIGQAAFELVGPVLYTFGNEQQKALYLPRILNADDFWCQGFSEPGAGSDLAALRTRAVRDGDHYLVNGHKLWTSEGHYADMMFALVRTNTEVKPQAGISFLLIDMRDPGISVRPILTLDEGHSVNEVFIDNVRVPVANLVGEEGKGWGYAKFLLGNERTMSAEVPHTKQDLALLKNIASRELRNGRPLLEDSLFRAKVAQLEIDLLALEFSVLRVLNLPENDPGLLPVASVLKMRGAELRQRVSELSVEALGDYGAAFYPDPEGHAQLAELVPPGPDYASGVVSKFLFRRATTIYGGANEVQRNIIAKSILGL